MIKTLYEEKEVMLAWLRSAPKAYKQWLQESRESEVGVLKNADDERYMYRAQGRLQVIDRLINLERELQTEAKSK